MKAHTTGAFPGSNKIVTKGRVLWLADGSAEMWSVEGRSSKPIKLTAINGNEIRLVKPFHASGIGVSAMVEA